jgi:hypothetical protein
MKFTVVKIKAGYIVQNTETMQVVGYPYRYKEEAQILADKLNK